MLTADFTHRSSELDNQFVYILDGIDAANIFGGNCHLITDSGSPGKHLIPRFFHFFEMF